MGIIAFVWGVFFTLSANASDSTALERLACGIVEQQSSFTLPQTKQDITILMIGSSSTSGVGADGALHAYPARTAVHLNARNHPAKVHVVAKGIGGERAKAAVQRLANAIQDTAPDIIVWQVGTNDALGKVPLEELSETLQKGFAIIQAHKLPLVLIDPQFFPRILNNQNYTNTVELITRTAENHGLPVVKRYQRMKQALGHDDDLMSALMAKDRFHMSRLGHECLALDLTATLTTNDVTFVKEE